jgi:hypothetical protein
MFNTLESNWNQSARRGWTTLASFGFQAMALSLLLLIPLLTIQGPTRLELFSRPPISVPSPPAPQSPESTQRPIHSLNIRHGEILQPRSIPRTIANLDERPLASAPDVSGIGVIGSTGSGWDRWAQPVFQLKLLRHRLFPRPLIHLKCRTGQRET